MNSNVVTIICTILEILSTFIIFKLTLYSEKKKNKLNFYKKFHDMYSEFDQDRGYKFCDFPNEQEESLKIFLLENEQYLPSKISESLHELLNNLKKYPICTNEENSKECDNIANDCDKIFDDIKKYIFDQYEKNKKKL